MWQRIQTLYLAVSTILMAFMLFSVKAVTVAGDGTVMETYKYLTYIPYAVLIIIILLLDVLALTTYKIRVFQYHRSRGIDNTRTSDLARHRILREPEFRR